MAEYVFPVIFPDNKRFAIRRHVVNYSGYSLAIINSFIDKGDIAITLIDRQLYIDVDEALRVLSKSRFHPKRATFAASKVLTPEQKQDLFV